VLCNNLANAWCNTLWTNLSLDSLGKIACARNFSFILDIVARLAGTPY